MRIQRGAALSAGLALAWLGLAQPGAAVAQARSPEQSLVNRYCLGCHNDRALQGGLSLEAAPLDDVASHAEVWERVVRKLRAGAMPPAGSARPEAATYQGLLTYIETALDARAAAAPNPGRTETFRRLNRTEYRNAVRDLLALDVDVDALLPRDDASYGFDKRRRGRAVADADGAVPVGRAEDQPARRRQLGHRPGQPGRHPAPRPDPGGAPRRAAVRHPRRRGRRPQLPSRRRVRDRGAAGPQPERERRGVARPPRGRDAARRRAPEAVQRGPRPQPARRLLRRRGGRPAPQPAAAGRGRPPHCGRRLPAQERGPHRDRAAALPGSVQPGPASAAAAGGALGVDQRPVQPRRGRRHAEPRPHLHVPAPDRGRRDGLRHRDHLDPGPARLPPAGLLRRHRDAPVVLRAGPRRRRLRGRHRAGPPRAAGKPRVPLPHRGGPGGRGAGHALPARRPRARLAPVVLPLEQHPRRRAPRPRRGRQARRPGGARGAGAADARRPAGGDADQQLRRPVAPSPQPGDGDAEPAPLPPTSTTTCGRRSGARPSCSSTASSARTAASSTSCGPTTRSSTSASPGTTASPGSTAAASGASTCRRAASAAGCWGTAAF